ncbi:MAG TPA: sigma-70 family RNA polymerase sigma factor [Actinomycetota bacterium]|jgi:RNA polymerase sigma factor (sigma-70 family)
MEERRLGDLVQAAAAGDRHAWDLVVDRFSGLLWSVAAGYRLSQADAADVFQATWLKLLENLGNLRDPERVGAWLATTARHECLRALRRLDRFRPVSDERELEPEGAGPPPPEVMVLESERNRALWKAFAQLSERCQRLLRVVVVVSPPYEEAAAALEMPVGSIGPTRARCLARLRQNLVGGGINAEAGDSWL